MSTCWRRAEAGERVSDLLLGWGDAVNMNCALDEITPVAIGDCFSCLLVLVCVGLRGFGKLSALTSNCSPDRSYNPAQE